LVSEPPSPGMFERPSPNDEAPAGAGKAGAAAGGVGGDAGAPVLLATLYDPVEAEIVAAKLRSAGIDVFVRHEALSTVFGLTVNGAGQQDILVRPEDLEAARAALEAE